MSAKNKGYKQKGLIFMSTLAVIFYLIVGACIGAFIMAFFKLSALASERERAEHAIKMAKYYQTEYEKAKEKGKDCRR